jgi:hypothetical protein
MGHERVAVVGIGQTKHEATRGDVSVAGLLREAAQRALADAQMTMDRHRRRRHRQGPRLLRGRHDAGAVPGRRARLHRQADVPGAHRRFGGRLHRHRRQPAIQAGIHERVLTVAFEKQSESEAMWALSLPIPFSRRCTPAPAATSPRTSAATSAGPRPRPRRHAGGAEGPPERAQEPLRPPARARHLLRLHQGLDDAVGPDPLRRDLPVLRRRLRPGARVGEGGRRRVAQGRKPAWIQGTAMRSEPTLSAERDTVLPLGGRCARPTCTSRRASPTPARTSTRRDVRAVQLVRAHVAREPRLRRAGRGLEDDRGRCHRHRRRPPGEHVRRRAVHQPHRCLGHAPLRRGGHAGPRHRRRPPDRRCPQGRGPRLRRRLPVLRDVGGRHRETLLRCALPLRPMGPDGEHRRRPGPPWAPGCGTGSTSPSRAAPWWSSATWAW